MTAPYRNDVDALRERLTALESEMRHVEAQAAHLDQLRAREAALRAEADGIRRRLAEGAAKRALPMLDRVKVASPCSASWADMLGDERVRFCLACEKNVYNLSEMSRDEAEALLASKADGEMCVRYYQRADGTILTSDCPVGAKKKRRKQLALAVAGAGAMAAAAVSALSRQGQRVTMGAMPVSMGAVAMVEVPSPKVPAIMGSVAARPVADAPPEHVKMGKRAVTR